TPAVPGVDSASRELSARYRTGVVYGFLSALFTVCATFMTKAGSAGVGTVTATQIRIGSAFAGFTLFALATRKLPEVAAAVRDARGITVIAVASIFGPFIGVALLLYAIQHSNAGIAAALSSLSPVLILLPSRFLDKRRITAGEVGGALITTAGILLMFGIF
ncbi:MAG TPA: DMT family transporter, partial [Treponemataceae bacterium]|nr:DMT family transporter [Treponemataceae bacterium]